MNDIRICPVCMRKTKEQVPLTASERRLVCPRNHSFDLASGGYVNLLSPSAGSHGDNKEMVMARRAFLDSGIYEPLRNALAEEAERTLPGGASVWDSGCGEGYYTSALATLPRDYRVYGSDLSTAALKEAHKRCSSLILSAASSYSLPAADASCDGIICIFAPEALEEFTRVLKPNGLLILVIPGRRHLFGLKEVLYENPYENAPRDPALAGFQLIKDRRLHYTKTLSSAKQIQALFAMTPYAYRTGALGRERLLSLDELSTEIDFHLLIYRKSE